MLWIRMYSTAQLQGNVRTRFRRVSHAFWTRPSSSEKGAWHSRTSCCSFIARFCACMDASHVRPRRILHAFQTRSDVTLELSCTVCKYVACCLISIHYWWLTVIQKLLAQCWKFPGGSCTPLLMPLAILLEAFLTIWNLVLYILRVPFILHTVIFAVNNCLDISAVWKGKQEIIMEGIMNY